MDRYGYYHHFAESHLYFPYLLQGYYKQKYTEQYRNWEGKAQLEWYGEEVISTKHIKGTAKEIKREELAKNLGSHRLSKCKFWIEY